MIDNVSQLVGGETNIKGVADSPATGDGVIEFEVLVIVPGKGAHPVPWFNAQSAQYIRQFFHPFVQVGVGVVVH